MAKPKPAKTQQRTVVLYKKNRDDLDYIKAKLGIQSDAEAVRAALARACDALSPSVVRWHDPRCDALAKEAK